MSKSIIATEKAPAAIGPYVQATKLGDLVFTSGQIPLIPETMQLVTGDIKVQAEQVLRNLSAILEAAGASTATVMKTTCFLKDMNDFFLLNSFQDHITTLSGSVSSSSVSSSESLSGSLSSSSSGSSSSDS
jgi:reactive intermediate/imine deaminase